MFRLPTSRPLSLIGRYFKRRNTPTFFKPNLYTFKSLDGPHPFDIEDQDLIAIELIAAYDLKMFHRVPILKEVYRDYAANMTQQPMARAGKYFSSLIKTYNSQNVKALVQIIARINYRIAMFFAMQEDGNGLNGNVFGNKELPLKLNTSLGLTETFIHLTNSLPFAKMELHKEGTFVFMELTLIDSRTGISPESFTLHAQTSDLNMTNVNTAIASLITHYCKHQFNNSIENNGNWSYTGTVLSHPLTLDEGSILRLVEEISAVDISLLPTVLYILLSQINNFSNITRSLKETTKLLSSGDGRSRIACKYSDLKSTRPN
jgi:hypothetical protein